MLLIGLFGTCLSCVGFGFSRSFYQAAIFRVLGGALNGNVGVMRTMISEIIKEKRFQSRAFLLLPMCFNIGVIVGPILGGLLSDPVESYPRVFGKNSVLGGSEGVWWMEHWPYALPNLISAVFLFGSAAAVVFGLEEVRTNLSMRCVFEAHVSPNRLTAPSVVVRTGVFFSGALSPTFCGDKSVTNISLSAPTTHSTLPPPPVSTATSSNLVSPSPHQPPPQTPNPSSKSSPSPASGPATSSPPSSATAS